MSTTRLVLDLETGDVETELGLVVGRLDESVVRAVRSQPDLLAACEAAFDGKHSYIPADGGSFRIPSSAVASLRAAIRRARGES